MTRRNEHDAKVFNALVGASLVVLTVAAFMLWVLATSLAI